MAKNRLRETFVPLVYPPGCAQVDFGEAIGGIRQKLHEFFMDLPHSDAPPPQFNNEFNHFLKNVAIVGGLPLVAATTGNGRDERA